jgi:hypothetical protein
MPYLGLLIFFLSKIGSRTRCLVSLVLPRHRRRARVEEPPARLRSRRQASASVSESVLRFPVAFSAPYQDALSCLLCRPESGPTATPVGAQNHRAELLLCRLEDQAASVEPPLSAAKRRPSPPGSAALPSPGSFCSSSLM